MLKFEILHKDGPMEICFHVSPKAMATGVYNQGRKFVFKINGEMRAMRVTKTVSLFGLGPNETAVEITAVELPEEKP